MANWRVIVGDVLDADGQLADSFGQVTRNEKFLFAPASIARDDGMLRFAKFPFGAGIAVNAGVAAGGVPLAHISPFGAGPVRPDPNLSPLVRIEVVKFTAQHHAEIFRVQAHLELRGPLHRSDIILLGGKMHPSAAAVRAPLVA